MEMPYFYWEDVLFIALSSEWQQCRNVYMKVMRTAVHILVLLAHVGYSIICFLVHGL